MDTRAPQAFVPMVVAAEPRAKRGSAATDMPKAKTVEPTAAPVKTGNEQLRQEEERRADAQARADAMRWQSELDVRTHEATGSIVIQNRDPETGEVVHQFPNNATLKSRAIARYEAVQGAPAIKRTI